MSVCLLARQFRSRMAAGTIVALNLALLPCRSPAQNEAESVSSTLTGGWSSRRRIEETGVRPFAVFIGEAWSNVRGGLQQRGWWNSLLDFGVELNTDKLGWWEGGSFLVQAHWVQNERRKASFGDYTGAINPVSSIMAGNHLRVYSLHYRHSWQNDAVVLKAGQLAMDDDFMASEYAGLFLNSAFGAMPSQVGTPLSTSCGGHPPFPIYSVAAPGLFLRARPAQAISTQLGLYYGKPGFDEGSNYGFDWAGESPPELGLFWESGCSYTLAKHAASFRFGLSYHTGLLDDFKASTTRHSPVSRQTVPNYYAIHDVQLLTDAKGQAKLGLFCRAGITQEPDLSTVAWYADAGLNWFAPLPGRPEDVAGIAASFSRYGQAFRRSTGASGVAENETSVELTYQAHLTRWLTLQQDTQILMNPALNANSHARETALVLGLRTIITF